MKNFILILVLIIISFILITFILHKIFKSKKFVKYIPSIAAIALGAYSIYLARTSTQGFQGIGFMLLGIMSFAGFLSGFISGIFLDYMLPRIKK